MAVAAANTGPQSRTTQSDTESAGSEHIEGGAWHIQHLADTVQSDTESEHIEGGAWHIQHLADTARPAAP